MMPLNYAILTQFLTAEEADADTIMETLKPQYGRFRSLKKPAVVEALMAAEANGLIDESRIDLDDQQQLRVFYKVNDYGKDMIEKYIGTAAA